MTNKTIEAQHPGTSHSRLRELSQDQTLRMALLSNPSLPIELAAQLRKQIAGVANAETPDAHTLELLAKEASEQTDAERLVWLSQYGGDVTRAVARNPKTPMKHLKKLAESRDTLVLCEILRNPAINSEDIAMLRAGYAKHHVERAVAASSKVQPELLVSFIKNNSKRKIIQSAAQNPALPLYGMIELWLNRKNWAVKLYEKEVANDQRAQTLAPWLGRLRNLARPGVWRMPSVIAELYKAEGCDAILRETLFQVSQMPNFYVTEGDLKKLLAGDKSVIALQLTQGYYSTTAYLSSQAKSESSRVRAQVAANYRTAPEDLELLAGDNDEKVRLAVAQNYRTGAAALQKLSQEKNSNVRLFVARHYQANAETLIELAKDVQPAIRVAVAQNNQAPAEALLLLSREENEAMQLAVLSHAKLPAESRVAFLSSKSEKVRERLASLYLSAAVLNVLCKDASLKVRKIVAKNTGLTGEQLEILAIDEATSIRMEIVDHPKITSEILSRLAKDELVKVRAAVAARYRANVDTLALLAKDKSKLVRLAVAKNKKARKTTLQRLSNDSDERVQKAAKLTMGTSVIPEPR